MGPSEISSTLPVKNFLSTTDALRLSGLTRLHTRHNGANINPVRVLGNQQEIHVRRRSHHSLLLAVPNLSGNMRATCRGVVAQAFADPAVHRRITGKYKLDVFGGSGFVAKATNHLGLRGCVRDTKFGPRYDVTRPLVLTRIRQDVSAGKCVAAMISPPRPHSSCSPNVLSASAAIANLLHRARMSWILEHPCVHGSGTYRKSRPLRQPRTAWTMSVHGPPSRTMYR